MVTFGRLIFKATGVLSNKGLVKNGNRIGEGITNAMHNNGGKVEVTDVQRIVENVVGKKVASRIDFIGRDTFVKRAMETGGFSESDISKTLDFADALTLPAKYNRRASIFLKGSIDNPEVAALTTHELHHALSFSSGRLSVPKFLGRFSWGRKLIDKAAKFQKEFGLQDRSNLLYIEALRNVQLGRKFSPEQIKEMLYSKGIITIGDDKNNIRILKALRKLYQDEYRAYSLQARTLEGMGYKEHGSIYRNLANEFNTLAQNIGKEAKQLRINHCKRFLGMKPAEVTIPKPKAVQGTFVKAENSENSIAKKIFDKPTG